MDKDHQVLSVLNNKLTIKILRLYQVKMKDVNLEINLNKH